MVNLYRVISLAIWHRDEKPGLQFRHAKRGSASNDCERYRVFMAQRRDFAVMGVSPRCELANLKSDEKPASVACRVEDSFWR